MADKIVNTDHVETVEVEVKKWWADWRTWLSVAIICMGSAVTAGRLMAGTLDGYAWFAPIMTAGEFITLWLTIISKAGVESKNKRVEAVRS